MRIKIIAVGQNMPDWVEAGFKHYQKRIKNKFKCQLIEISAEKRLKNKTTEQILNKEAEKIDQHIKPGDMVIALDENGKTESTRSFAKQLGQWHDLNQTVCFIIGSADGLAPSCKDRANKQWSLGQLILPHPLVRIILIEQLYRAISILQNHPYHRD